MNRRALLLVCLPLAFGAGSTRAGVIIFDGSFSATDLPGPLSTLSGTYSFAFDDSAVPATGIYIPDEVPLTSLTLNQPVIGATTFDTSNSLGLVYYIDGVMALVGIGGAPFTAGGTGGVDDFLVWTSFNPALGGNWTQVGYGITSPAGGFTSDTRLGGNASHSFTSVASVPEPSSLVLLCAGAIGLIGYRRRQQTA